MPTAPPNPTAHAPRPPAPTPPAQPPADELQPLPIPADDLPGEDDFDWADPPVVDDFPKGPPIRVTLILSNRELEPLPFPAEDLIGTEWEIEE